MTTHRKRITRAFVLVAVVLSTRLAQAVPPDVSDEPRSPAVAIPATKPSSPQDIEATRAKLAEARARYRRVLEGSEWRDDVLEDEAAARAQKLDAVMRDLASQAAAARPPRIGAPATIPTTLPALRRETAASAVAPAGYAAPTPAPTARVASTTSGPPAIVPVFPSVPAPSTALAPPLAPALPRAPLAAPPPPAPLLAPSAEPAPLLPPSLANAPAPGESPVVTPRPLWLVQVPVAQLRTLRAALLAEAAQIEQLSGGAAGVAVGLPADVARRLEAIDAALASDTQEAAR